MAQPPACDAHRALVDAAMGPSPDDDTLARYAAEVVPCEDCRRLLAIRLGAHPGRFAGPPATSLVGMERLGRAVQRRRVGRWAAGGSAGLATVAAAAALVAVYGPSAPPAPPSPAEPVPHAVHVTASPAPVDPDSLHAVTRVPDHGPRSLRPVDAAPPSPPPAPAPASDWPAPPFEELRGGAVKGEPRAVRAVELVLSGTPHVGGAIALTVVSSTDTALSVCVDGPERGIVWRGGVPAGRTALTQSGSPQQFAFAAPGRYRFSVATDAGACEPAVHVVEVDVR